MNKLFKNNIGTIITILVLGAGIVANSAMLSSRVLAIEERNHDVDPLVPQFITLQANSIQTAKDVDDIKLQLKEINEKQTQILVAIEQVKQQTK